jgi:hypothetical protein
LRRDAPLEQVEMGLQNYTRLRDVEIVASRWVDAGKDLGQEVGLLPVVALEADPVTGADDRLEERLRALRRHHVAGGVAGTCFKADVPLAPLVLPIGHVALRSVSLGYRCRRPIFGVLRGLFD